MEVEPSSAIEIKKEKEETVKKEKEEVEVEPEKINFKCSGCGMSELVDYFGKTPKFVRNIEFSEDSYVMKDPFRQPPTKNGTNSFTEYFILLGSHCTLCQDVVCQDCRLFFKSTFCYPCAESEVRSFPLEVQSKIRKAIVEIKNREK